MNMERMQVLIDAYGADPRRWPEAERDAAVAFLSADRARERLLFEARQIDLALDASPRPEVSPHLREQVIAMAAQAGLKARAVGGRGLEWGLDRLGLRRLALASGAGWAAACMAGVMVGMNATGHLVAEAEADAVLYQAMLEPLDDMEVLG